MPSESSQPKRFKAARTSSGFSPDFHIKSQYQFLFEQVKEGRKTVEVRVNAGFWKNVQEGDEKRVICDGDSVEVVVEAVRVHVNVAALLSNEDPDSIAPGKSRVEIERELRHTYERPKRRGRNRLPARKLDETGLIAFQIRLKVADCAQEAEKA